MTPLCGTVANGDVLYDMATRQTGRGSNTHDRGWLMIRRRSVLASREVRRGFFYRDARSRHLASRRLVIAFTLASCAAQKARLTAAVRILGARLAAGVIGKVGSKTNGTEIAAANGDPAAAKCARARPQ
jgi:hypothetical protein